MQGLLESVLSPILVLGLLIFVHELGHFLLAKFWGVRVLEFAIGFGKQVVARQWGETVYSLRIVPLGGFVRMSGEELPEEGEDGVAAVPPGEDTSRWFVSQSIPARFSIVFAGPFFNLIFAVAVSVFSAFIYGKVVMSEHPTIGGVLPGEPAASAGLMPGDIVKSINGRAIPSWLDLVKAVTESGGAPMTFAVKRPTEGGQQEIKEIIVAAKEVDTVDEIAALRGEERRVQGFRIGAIQGVVREPIGGIGEAVVYGVDRTISMAVMTLRGIIGMVRGVISTRNLGGPIFILQEAGRSAQRGYDVLLDFMILLSVSLAVLNLLPIPILDGGHLLFFIIEAIIGGPVSVRVRERAQQVGLALLLLLLVVALSNDIQRLLS